MSRPDFVLLLVDLQRYYLDPTAPFRAWAESRIPGALDYIADRVGSSVVPAVHRLKTVFRSRGWPIAYLRLCGSRPDRSDLHRFFLQAHLQAASEGFADLYPLASDPLADILPELAPEPGDAVFDKTTFSGFSTGGLASWLERTSPRVLAFAGLATSQCVDTTARDASDRGYGVLHIEDAQADYGGDEHHASLFASQGVCGGKIVSSTDFCEDPISILRDFPDLKPETAREPGAPGASGSSTD